MLVRHGVVREKVISQQCLFELRRPLAIDGSGGPVVRPVRIAPLCTKINHLVQDAQQLETRHELEAYWFNSEHHAGLHHSDSFVLGIMRNIRRTME